MASYMTSLYGYDIEFSGNSYQAPLLGLYGYSTDVAVARAVTRKVTSIRKKLWAQACRVDGIPADSNFVVFTEKNKHAVMYNQFMLQHGVR